MNTGSHSSPGIRLALLACAALALVTGALAAREAAAPENGLQRYIVELNDPPLALYDGGAMSLQQADGPQRLAATAPGVTGEAKLDTDSPAAQAYLKHLNERQDSFQLEARRLLGRQIVPVHVYRAALNGMALDLTQADAAALADSPLVKSIRPDTRHHLHSFAGPAWIGGAEVWSGDSGFAPKRGEGVVVGIIDSGVNWESPSFSDTPLDGFSFVNPYGEQLGLCADEEVECNDKLVGVYDFVEDDPSTDEVVEEFNNGRDNSGHGSHVSSIAVGNPVSVLLNGSVNADLSGVAPRSNLISYRVCFIGDPPESDGGGCQGSAIFSAIDQAIMDEVDVINYSIGSDARDPWSPGGVSGAFLGARSAGILIATSAGNSGPKPQTIGSPANAPWMVAVGNATHNQLLAFRLNFSDGPTGLACLEGDGPEVKATFGPQPVVFAGDVGDPLGCSAFPAGSMNSAIALISRGDCLFTEKAANAAAAGAEFMIVFNNNPGPPIRMSLGSSTIPSCMISNDQGIVARDFVQNAPGAMGRVDYPAKLLANDAFGDNLADSSSRGPAMSPIQDVLKPNLIAPGTSILAAVDEGQQFGVLSGTSMASPHVAGAAALIKSVHPDWNASQIATAIETTATPELARVGGGTPASPHQRGSGRPRLGDAVNAGLYLPLSGTQFTAANPLAGGDPKSLNLAGLVDSKCQGSCSFQRSVTDQMGGGSWTAVAEGFPPGVLVTVLPSAFNLTNGGSRQLTVSIDLANSGIVGEWVSGSIRLAAAGSVDQMLTLSVFAHGGDLPDGWTIDDDRDGGWEPFELSGLAAMPDATLRSGGLTRPTRTEKTLVQDSSPKKPYNGGNGVFTVWHELPQGGLWIYAETLASEAVDLDLFVGRDDNGNGIAEESEELCASTSPIDLERCDLFDEPPGDYWVLVQNWQETNEGGDAVTLLSAAIGPSADSTLAASGPGIVESGETFPVRLSWDNLAALPGEQWLGAVGVGTSRDRPTNIGVIPVYFNRDGIAAPTTFPLMNGATHRLAIDAGGTHDRLFIDVPPGADSLSVEAVGATAAQNNDLSIELVRLGFAAALANPPFAAPPGSAPVVASAAGGDGAGPTLTVNAPDLKSGRWYVVLSNASGSPGAVEITAQATFSGAALPIHRGLWEPSSRPGISQGYDFNWGGSSRALIWFSYDEDGQPSWYIAGAPATDGNIWTSELLRVTNDGAQQQLAPVGALSVTQLAENDQLFSFTLFGESGTERMQALSAQTCPLVGGLPRSYTGLWFRGVDGLGGASVLMNTQTQAQIHYLFDAAGEPRWLFAQDLVDPEPTNATMPILQFSGFCAVCDSAPVSSTPVGLLERDLTSETAGSWILDYLFEAPLEGSVKRTDQIVKLTGTLDCP